MTRFAVTGGRDYSDVAEVERWLTRVFNAFRLDAELIYGCARGADTIAAACAIMIGWKTIPVPADWERDGRAAGPIRNGLMLDLNPKFVIAFPGWRGTANMIKQTRGRKIPVIGPHPDVNDAALAMEILGP